MTQSWKSIIDARNIALNALVSAGVVDQPTSPVMNLDHQKIVMIVGGAIESAIAAAVAAEREACAMIAENDDEDRRGYAQGSIAAAIRARNEATK